MSAELTSQEEAAIEFRLKGLTKTEAYTRAGYSGAQNATRFFNRPVIAARLQELRTDLSVRYKLTKDDVIAGMMDATHMAANAMELVAAWREIGKLLGAYEEKVTIDVKHQHEFSQKQLENMSEAQLIQLAGLDRGAIDADYELVEEPTADESLPDLRAGEETDGGLLPPESGELHPLPDGGGERGASEEVERAQDDAAGGEERENDPHEQAQVA